ncbi:hypothetical protein HH303_02100 [Rhodospirillaceae bacterium KN72]|uniref:Lipoprotein n=1 Tax=Pacificispira spongiicola TaxID=2729598 RepID=A0A7Y0HET6_9PROT|nr:hypothetical protein [Pacificispira spongiicola]NMM43252.1 hypothetical protein [Pacificispira spongiicola]
MSRVLSVLVLSTALLVAACGPIPQPYRETAAEKADNPLLAIPDGAGITVAPVTGADPALSGPLTEALVAEFEKIGIPASAGAALTNALLLEGASRWRDGQAVIDWRLTDPDGVERAFGTTQVNATQAAYDMGSPFLIQDIARDGALLIAAALRPELAVPIEEFGAPKLAVIGVRGAPGDGDRALGRAMGAVLKRAGIDIQKDPDAADVQLAGTVSVEPINEAAEKVDIHWVVMDRDGNIVGSLTQSNAVPKGALDDRWGQAAYDAAFANVDAIQAILDRMAEMRSLGTDATQ